MFSPAEITALLTPWIAVDEHHWPDLPAQLQTYLALLLKWNARTNLTAIRDPTEIIRRHFGESLFAAQRVGPTNSLLDLGSGAGFPGIPIQLLHPNLPITLAESQGKKAAFLQELIRTLDLPTQVWPRRAEDLPPTRRFHTVTLRAVDDMPAALAEAARRATHRILVLTTTHLTTTPPAPASSLSADPLKSSATPEAPHSQPTTTPPPRPTAVPDAPRRGTDVRALRARPASTPLESYLPGFNFRAIPVPRSESGILLIADRQNPAE